jgi:hypothetical protein
MSDAHQSGSCNRFEGLVTAMLWTAVGMRFAEMSLVSLKSALTGGGSMVCAGVLGLGGL